MKIIREGKEIELTSEELASAHAEFGMLFSFQNNHSFPKTCMLIRQFIYLL